MDILILGATGNTGSEVVKQLQAQQAQFAVMVREASKAQSLALQPGQIRLGDYSDVASMTAAMQGVKRIYLAMPVSPNNFQWVENVIAAAKLAKVEQVVKLSGLGATKDAGSEVIRTHALSDKLLIDSGLAYTLIQPNSFYQNLYGSLETIKQQGAFYLPLRDAKQSVLDIRDVAAVVVKALTEDGHQGQSYQLTGPQALSFEQQAAELAKAAGKPISYVAISRDDCQQALQAAGLGEWLSGQLAEIFDWFAQGNYAYTTNTVEQVLGRPARRFEDFAKEFAQAL